MLPCFAFRVLHMSAANNRIVFSHLSAPTCQSPPLLRKQDTQRQTPTNFSTHFVHANYNGNWNEKFRWSWEVVGIERTKHWKAKRRQLSHLSKVKVSGREKREKQGAENRRKVKAKWEAFWGTTLRSIDQFSWPPKIAKIRTVVIDWGKNGKKKRCTLYD